MEAEIGVMQGQTKECKDCWEPPEARKSKDFPQKPSDTLTADLQSPELEVSKSSLF